MYNDPVPCCLPRDEQLQQAARDRPYISMSVTTKKAKSTEASENPAVSKALATIQTARDSIATLGGIYPETRSKPMRATKDGGPRRLSEGEVFPATDRGRADRKKWNNAVAVLAAAALLGLD